MATFALQDYLQFDELEDVSFIYTAPTGNDWNSDGSINWDSTTVGTVKAIIREVSQKDIVQYGGQLRIGDVWILSWRHAIDQEDTDYTPVKGHQVQRASNSEEKYEILGVDYSKFTGKYRIHCRR